MQQANDTSHKQSMSSYQNIAKSRFVFIMILLIRSDHNFAHAMTAQLS